MLQEIPSHLRHRPFRSTQDRRQFLATLGLGGLFFTRRGAFAQALVLTPEQTLGPYYPDRLPLDRDNDLLIINDNITPAVGEIAWVSGRVLDRNGQPVRGALVEIWQADNNGAYIHSASPIANRDANFQGYGRFLTGSSGAYLFRTVKPGIYPGRTRHIHYAVTAPGQNRFTTQLYVNGEALNSSDGVLNGIRDSAQRASVIATWAAMPNSNIGELAATFNIVLGYTPTENPAPSRPTLVSMSGVVNGATIYPGAAPGAWVTLFGDGLAPSSRTWQPADIVDGKLPQSLDGVSVSINNKPAAVHYISSKQINVLAPTDVGAGAVQATVTNANGTSDPVSVDVQSYMPGFFELAQDYVLAVRADGAYIGPAGLVDGLTTVPARPGDRVLLYGTGFGATNPAAPPGETFQGPLPLASAVTIRIHTTVVTTEFAGLTGPGLYQFNVTIPELPDGDYPVTAEIAGVRTQKIGRIRIERQTTAAARRLPATESTMAGNAGEQTCHLLALLPGARIRTNSGERAEYSFRNSSL
jgi:protocatechuate 3,4-dioxygenase beta subunit